MDLKGHMLNFVSYQCWWIGKKSEIVIKWRQLIKKGSNYLLKNDEVRLENEIVISEIVWQPYKQFQKIPLIPALITHHWNSNYQLSELIKPNPC